MAHSAPLAWRQFHASHSFSDKARRLKAGFSEISRRMNSK
jgi:hypothetical protein